MAAPRPGAPGVRASAQEATTTASPAPASPPAASPSAASPLAGLDDFGPLLEDASASAAAEEEPEGIPGIGAVDVVGNVKHAFADEDFPCEGPSPDGELVL